MHHLQYILISQVLTNKSCNLSKLIKPNLPLLLLIIQIEHPLYPIFCLVLTCFLTHYLDEFIKVEDFVLLTQGPYDVQYIRVSLVNSKILQHFYNLLRVDGPTTILIKEQEDIS